MTTDTTALQQAREALHNLHEACLLADVQGDLAGQIDGSLLDAASEAIAAIDAALEIHQAHVAGDVGVTPGVWVPLEPTEEMVKAAVSAADTDAFGAISAWPSETWKAMLAAAPPPGSATTAGTNGPESVFDIARGTK